MGPAVHIVSRCFTQPQALTLQSQYTGDGKEKIAVAVTATEASPSPGLRLGPQESHTAVPR